MKIVNVKKKKKDSDFTQKSNKPLTFHRIDKRRRYQISTNSTKELLDKNVLINHNKYRYYKIKINHIYIYFDIY